MDGFLHLCAKVAARRADCCTGSAQYVSACHAWRLVLCHGAWQGTLCTCKSLLGGLMALLCLQGMLQLHSHKPPILHRDLKSPNLLVDKHWRVKIADFNLSRVMEAQAVVSSISANNPRYTYYYIAVLIDVQPVTVTHAAAHLGPALSIGDLSKSQASCILTLSAHVPWCLWSIKLHSQAGDCCRWLAPEVVKDQAYSTAADVYSFGLILWELLTWQLPWAELGPFQVDALSIPVACLTHRVSC